MNYYMRKEAGIGSAIAKIAPKVLPALKAAKKPAMVGAGVGGVLGALTPEKTENPDGSITTGSRVDSALKGAMSGGLTGGLLSAGKSLSAGASKSLVNGSKSMAKGINNPIPLLPPQGNQPLMLPSPIKQACHDIDEFYKFANLSEETRRGRDKNDRKKLSEIPGTSYWIQEELKGHKKVAEEIGDFYEKIASEDGKIPEIEEACKNPIEKKVAYMIATSHEYKKPNILGALRLVKNYNWELSKMKIKDMQGIDKPVKEDKVRDMVKNMNGVKPFIVVNQFHGIRPQTPGKKILLDGHHRKQCCIYKGIEEVPVYKGTYTGGAEKKINDFLEKKASETPKFKIEDAKRTLNQLGYDTESVPFTLEDFAYGMNVELEHGKTRGQDTNLTNNDPLKSAQITLAHMKESPKYYKELRKMEEKLEVKASDIVNEIYKMACER